jgi:hypothetical protein
MVLSVSRFSNLYHDFIIDVILLIDLRTNNYTFFKNRCRNGMRVYAMYPKTTSFYPATVIDNTTYCQEQDNIIVVEFDDDEGMYWIYQYTI